MVAQADALRRKYSAEGWMDYMASRLGPDAGESELTVRYRAWLRTGENAPEKLKASLGVGSGVVGAYLVPPRLLEVVLSTIEASPGMRQVATVIVTKDGRDLAVPIEDDTGNAAAIIAEGAATIDTEDPVFLQVLLKGYLYSSGTLRCGAAWLQDSPLAEEVVVRILARRIAKLQNTHFTTGDDTGKPSGLLQTCQASGVTTAAADALSYAEAVALMTSVDAGFLVRGTWMTHPATLPIIAAITTPGGGPAWAADPDNPGGMLLGRPVDFNVDFPLFSTGGKAITFGDHSKYLIRDAGSFAVKRTSERYAEYLQLGFLGFLRSDGELSVPAAVKHLVVGP